jgi:hypothetical protein
VASKEAKGKEAGVKSGLRQKEEDKTAYVFDELRGGERLSAEEQIRRARVKHVSVLCPRGAEGGKHREGQPGRSLQTSSGRGRVRTNDLLLVRQALSQLS